MNSVIKVESGGRKDRAPLPTPKRMGPGFALVGAMYALGVLLQHLLKWRGFLEGGGARIWFVVVGLIAFTVVVAAGWNKKWHRFLTSNRFAVPVILMVTFLSIVGTLVLQNQPEQVLRKAYGSTLDVLRTLFLDDIFHSFGFTAVLGLGAGGLALVITRRRRWTLRYTGSVGAHLGLLLILTGASVGSVWGVKGQLNLHTGQSSDRFLAPTLDGEPVPIPLDFVVRLDDFRLEHYTPDYRLMVFMVEGESEKRLVSIDPFSKAAGELRAFGVEILDYWPDYVQETIVEPLQSEPATGSSTLAALGLMAGGQGTSGVLWLFDEGQPDGGQLDLGGTRVNFFWDAKRAERFLEELKESVKAQVASAHVLVVGDRRLPVEAGKSYPFPGTDNQLEILRTFSDFVMDTETKSPQNRSDRPNNPAIELAVKDAFGKQLGRTWLFSKFPKFQHQGLDFPIQGLRYIYQGDPGQAGRWMILSGESANVWLVSRTTFELNRSELKVGGVLGIGDSSLTVRALYPSVRRSYRDATRSDREDNPVVRLQVGGESAPRMLNPKQPIRLAGGKMLVLAPKGGDMVRDYLSVVSVFEEGQEILTKMVEVNHPLEYQGFTFYQADYRPDDPTFSGFQVVHDPGLWITYLGFVSNAVGVFCVLFLPPMLRRWRAAREARGGDS